MLQLNLKDYLWLLFKYEIFKPGDPESIKMSMFEI